MPRQDKLRFPRLPPLRKPVALPPMTSRQAKQRAKMRERSSRMTRDEIEEMNRIELQEIRESEQREIAEKQELARKERCRQRQVATKAKRKAEIQMKHASRREQGLPPVEPKEEGQISLFSMLARASHGAEAAVPAAADAESETSDPFARDCDATARGLREPQEEKHPPYGKRYVCTARLGLPY